MRWPWPSRAERDAAVRQAELEAARAQLSASRARKLAAELRAIDTDAFARILTEGFTGDGSGQ